MQPVTNIDLVCQRFIHMAHASGCDYETPILHLIIDPVYKTFDHSQVTINHSALHTGDGIQT